MGAGIADAIFASFPQYGLKPRREDYSALISCNISNVQRCRELIKEMQDVGLPPDRWSHQELLQAEIEAGNQTEAIALISELRERGVEFTPKLHRFAESLGVA